MPSTHIKETLGLIFNFLFFSFLRLFFRVISLTHACISEHIHICFSIFYALIRFFTALLRKWFFSFSSQAARYQKHFFVRDQPWSPYHHLPLFLSRACPLYCGSMPPYHHHRICSIWLIYSSSDFGGHRQSICEYISGNGDSFVWICPYIFVFEHLLDFLCADPESILSPYLFISSSFSSLSFFLSFFFIHSSSFFFNQSLAPNVWILSRSPRLGCRAQVSHTHPRAFTTPTGSRPRVRRPWV